MALEFLCYKLYFWLCQISKFKKQGWRFIKDPVGGEGFPNYHHPEKCYWCTLERPRFNSSCIITSSVNTDASISRAAQALAIKVQKVSQAYLDPPGSLVLQDLHPSMWSAVTAQSFLKFLDPEDRLDHEAPRALQELMGSQLVDSRLLAYLKTLNTANVQTIYKNTKQTSENKIWINGG